MKRLLLGILIVFSVAGIALAETVSAPDPSSVLGARPLGMGGAFVAVADDANAVFINPAGLSKLDDWSLTSMSTQLLQKIDYKLAAGTYKMGPGTLGVGYIGSSSTAGYVYSDAGTLESTSPISYSSNLLVLSYGLNMDNVIKMTGKSMGDLAVGGSVKMISQGMTGVDNAQASGMSFDLGATLKPADFPASFGAALKNLGGGVSWATGSKEDLEQSLDLGAAVNVLGKDGLFKNIPGDLVAGLELQMLSEGKPMVFHLGGEYKPIKYLSIRAGIDQSPLSKSKTATAFTLGIGVIYNGFSFDYAYRADPDAAELSNHYFSISYRPEDAKVAKEDNSKSARVTEEPKDNTKTQKDSKKDKDTSSNGDIYTLPAEYQNLGLDK